MGSIGASLAFAASLLAQSSEPPPVKWKLEVWGSVRCAPAVADGTAYAVCSAGQGSARPGTLFAVDLKAGKVRWSTPFQCDATGLTPAASERVVCLVETGGSLRAFDVESGALKWETSDGRGAPVAADGIVFFPAARGLSAADIHSGRKRWTNDSEGGAATPAVVGDDRVFYATATAIFALDRKTARQHWSFACGTLGGALAFGEGVVCATAENGSVLALDAQTGKELWKAPLDRPINGGLSIGDGLVCLADDKNRVTAYQLKTGTERWTYDVEGAVGAIAIHGGRVYFGCADHRVYALDAKEGKLAWQFKTGGEVVAVPVIADGLLLVGSADRCLYALDLGK